MSNLFTVTPRKDPYSMSKIKAGFNYLEFQSRDEMELLYNILTRDANSTFRGIDCDLMHTLDFLNEMSPLLMKDEFEVLSKWKQVAMKNFHLTTERAMILNRFKQLYPLVNWIFLSCEESSNSKCNDIRARRNFSTSSWTIHGWSSDAETERLLEDLVEHGLIRRFRITNERMEQVNKLSGL